MWTFAHDVAVRHGSGGANPAVLVSALAGAARIIAASGIAIPEAAAAATAAPSAEAINFLRMWMVFMMCPLLWSGPGGPL